MLRRVRDLNASSSNALTFTVTRNDLLFNFAASFADVFRFSMGDDDPFSPDTGVRRQEGLGFDFQRECSPALEILPPGELIRASTGQAAEDFAVYVTLEDIALSLREVVYAIDVSEIHDVKTLKIDLSSFVNFGFYRGFIVRCFIARRNDTEVSNKIWSASQIIHQSEFVVKATSEEALFEISWITFNNADERKNVLFFVEWISDDVSLAHHSECFRVNANNDLKAQFKRLESNPVFGEFCIRLVADSIIANLAENALRCAKLDVEPYDDSLHEKMRAMFKDLCQDFDGTADQYQKGDNIDRLRVVTEISRAVQRSTMIAQYLRSIRFGGYKQS